MKRYVKLCIFIGQLCLADIFTGCKKLIEIDSPIDQITDASVYSNDASATAVLTGMYEFMSMGSFATGINSISALTALSGDELAVIGTSSNIYQLIYTNNLSSLESNEPGYWKELYGYIYKVNSAIESISLSSKLSPRVKKQLLGESKFLRAFLYFYLTNLYGDVPLLTTTDYQISSTASRKSQREVYSLIVNDLLEAKAELNEDYVKSDLTSVSLERVRPNRAVASALLSRVYLYINENEKAEVEATSLIDNPNYELLDMTELRDVFLKDSREAIWQLQPVNPSANTEDGITFVLSNGPNQFNKPFFINSQLYNSFEGGDIRKSNWIGVYQELDPMDGHVVAEYPYPFKYKVSDIGQPVTEYLMVMRLAEQYLIRAESRARLGRINGANSAETDVNAVRTRAGLAETTFSDLSAANVGILNERRHELFSEWGHRWFDLKRLGKIDDVMPNTSLNKGGVWKSFKQLFPIPQQELLRNPNLADHQNPGY